MRTQKIALKTTSAGTDQRDNKTSELERYFSSRLYSRRYSAIAC